MKIDSVRFEAFATNSSSVHTPFIRTDKEPVDYLIGAGYDFGWQPFIAATQPAKRMYAALALQGNTNYLSKDIQDTIVRCWAGVLPSAHSYIDHQSVPVLPREYDGKHVSKQYFDDYLAWLLSPKIAIQGGNDNGGTPAIPGKPVKVALPSWDQFNCRKDAKGFYTLFSPENGTKIRMSFKDNVDMSKAIVPELVDLKITNKCSRNCRYCYQDSTPQGIHADSKDVYRTLEALAAMQVFEVAFGGGEPVEYPDFWVLVRQAKRLGIKPSFSTRNLAWLQDESALNTFKECCGAFAFSIDCIRDVYTLLKYIHKYDLECKTTVQYIPELNSVASLKEIIQITAMHSIPLTLLGLKNTGRGKTFVPNSESAITKITDMDMIEAVQGRYHVGIDTAFAKKYQRAIKATGASTWSYNIEEGKHSMYIDAVGKCMGKSSYCAEYSPLPERVSEDALVVQILKEFKKY
ncbi:Radical_SAM domain containing protein [uncultured Caudovirales phage]|uniref:Radical_SAM domain containing protein n=1 Tax=uncultured Caudovirales phage TaxID=2100421 RepID=A0A6J5LQS4_9CAUD|nr:Radical_SAM domain containing protein [uncultured Caudovirales phage]CAB4135266.1 Radical_SAM domain containing protein [uncultured Caudovirales phage]